MTPKNMRNYSIDTLKFICAFLVIFIHTPQPDVYYIAITPISRCAVPIFFMISGYYTFGKKITPPHFNPPQKVLHTYWGGLLIN